jgi:hypothetical protein
MVKKHYSPLPMTKQQWLYEKKFYRIDLSDAEEIFFAFMNHYFENGLVGVDVEKPVFLHPRSKIS